MNLPPELRLLIYSQIDAENVYLNIQPGNATWCPEADSREKARTMAILSRICRKLCNEVGSDVLYRNLRSSIFIHTEVDLSKIRFSTECLKPLHKVHLHLQIRFLLRNDVRLKSCSECVAKVLTTLGASSSLKNFIFRVREDPHTLDKKLAWLDEIVL